MDINRAENSVYKDIMGGSGELYLVPFTFDSQGYDYLFEPSYNLSKEEVDFKYKLMRKIEKALESKGMKLLNISFTSNKIVIGRK
jgi:hypothetical protein